MNKGHYSPKTVSGFDLFLVSSAYQKSVRMGLEDDALYWMAELWLSGYGEYAWKRIKIIASEDIGLASPMMPILIQSLYQSYLDQVKKKDPNHSPERLFLVHATIALCRSKKSRLIDWTVIDIFRNHEKRRRDIPDIAYDKHNLKGRRMGRGWEHFFQEGTILQNHHKMELEDERRLSAYSAVKDDSADPPEQSTLFD